MKENQYDFRARHWTYHLPDRRDVERQANANEVMLDESWQIGCGGGSIAEVAARDFREYLEVSMDLSLNITRTKGKKVLWIEVGDVPERAFVLDAKTDEITLTACEDKYTFRGTIHLEDMMNLEGAPVLPLGRKVWQNIYSLKRVHSETGLDVFPDEELLAMLHAGFDTAELFLEGVDKNHIGYCDFGDIMRRAERFGMKISFHNYIRNFIHPDDEGCQESFDKIYGEIVKRYPLTSTISLVGESLEFPSRDPHVSGKPWEQNVVDGIPDPRPSTGWYPCEDYPAYIQCIEKAIHKANPDIIVEFSTYNWSYRSLEERTRFLDKFPENVQLSVAFDVATKRKLGKLHTPVMDYTISVDEPGYYFRTECAAAAERGIALAANANTTGIAWDFGCVYLVPAPWKLLNRNRHLRDAAVNWRVRSHYATHHYGYWNSVAADLAKWSSWENYEPDYEELLRKIAIRDYGKRAADPVLAAWKKWDEAMNYYIASNEDQYGPWRVGAAYPFIFHPNLSRTMSPKEIKFPTAPHAHFGYKIIKTFYGPYENSEQSPGFMRYPEEIKALTKMLELWNEGLAYAEKAIANADERKMDAAQRFHLLAHFIRNSIVTTINIKKWYMANASLMVASSPEEADVLLDKIEKIAADEIANVKDTIPVAEADSRLGWEPSMEYVCDPWHLDWKLRQMDNALSEIAEFRKMVHLHEQE